ncbi:exodeoxyribonuclease VII small subunit [Mucisphaera sp.]|uniref:exodeoxyribonuclease VII small subunit n=1 Tax=Mucisphaera sp. TaxID=2913024 RepID=UPI003D141F9B
MAESKPVPAKNLSFEEALNELEGLVEAIEAGEIGLEDVLKRYERGVGLIHRCKDVLNRAEQKLAKLRIDEQGDDAMIEGDDDA